VTNTAGSSNTTVNYNDYITPKRPGVQLDLFEEVALPDIEFPKWGFVNPNYYSIVTVENL